MYSQSTHITARSEWCPLAVAICRAQSRFGTSTAVALLGAGAAPLQRPLDEHFVADQDALVRRVVVLLSGRSTGALALVQAAEIARSRVVRPGLEPMGQGDPGKDGGRLLVVPGKAATCRLPGRDYPRLRGTGRDAGILCERKLTGYFRVLYCRRGTPAVLESLRTPRLAMAGTTSHRNLADGGHQRNLAATRLPSILAAGRYARFHAANQAFHPV
jgi:hypothetical protein